MGSAPPPPNPQQALSLGNQTAQGQQSLNDRAQVGSAVNQNNPYGSLAYQQGVGPNGAPVLSADVNLNPTQQGLFNTLMGTKQTAGTQGSNVLSGANYGSQSPQDAIGNMTSGIEGDLMSKNLAYEQPFFNTSRQQLDTQLRNQGLLPGQPGYDNAMRGLDTSQGLTVNQLEASTQPQAFSQANTLYNTPLAQAQQLSQLGAPQDPNQDFVNAPQLQPANLTGAVSNAGTLLNNQYTAQEQQYSNMMKGLFGIGGTVLGGLAGGPMGASLGGQLGGLFGGGSTMSPSPNGPNTYSPMFS